MFFQISPNPGFAFFLDLLGGLTGLFYSAGAAGFCSQAPRFPAPDRCGGLGRSFVLRRFSAFVFFPFHAPQPLVGIEFFV